MINQSPGEFRIRMLGLFGILLLLCPSSLAQGPLGKLPTLKTKTAPPKPEELPTPKTKTPPPEEGKKPATPSPAETAALEAEACGVGPAVAISLPVALRLAQTTNLDIARAREVVNAAAAAYDRAKFAILPNFNLGSNYAHHEGNIQKTEGNIIKANRDSVFAGGGPSLTFGVSDALFLPLAARQVVAATEAGFVRVTNDTLLAVAEAYFAVLRARRRLARVQETLDYLVSNRPTRNRAGLKGLLPLIQAVVEAGAVAALPAELERVRVEVLRRQEERVAAIQDYRVASAELARLLRLDPALPLWPVEDFRSPVPLPGEAWLSRPVEELAQAALTNRPELAENRALVQAALQRVRNARYRPMLPNVVLNYNWGDFSGGPDLNPPIVRVNPNGTVTVTNVAGFGPSGVFRHFNTRTDFDATLVWRLNNLGFGNRAEIREQEALHRQLQLVGFQVQDLVVTQVVQAYEQVRGWRERMDITRRSLFDNRGSADGPVFRSLRFSFERIRGFEQARTLEVLDSIRSLNDLLDAYGQALTDYERTRFRLLVALGMPPEAFANPQLMPQPGTHDPGQGPAHP
jgi:outer membrane protein TolC